jgi:hypothetical protein
MGLARINDVLREQHKPTVAWGDINPLFLYNVQQWGQSYAGGSMEVDDFKNLTGGVEPMLKELMQAVQVKPKDENSNINGDMVKSFNASRVQAFGAGNVSAFDLPKTIRSSPRFCHKSYPQNKAVE